MLIFRSFRVKPIRKYQLEPGNKNCVTRCYLYLVKNKNIFRMHFDARRCRRRRLVRHPNSIRASTNQSKGRGSILLPPRAAVLPRLNAGSGGVKPTSNCIIYNLSPHVPLGT